MSAKCFDCRAVTDKPVVFTAPHKQTGATVEVTSCVRCSDYFLNHYEGAVVVSVPAGFETCGRCKRLVGAGAKAAHMSHGGVWCK